MRATMRAMKTRMLAWLFASATLLTVCGGSAAMSAEVAQYSSPGMPSPSVPSPGMSSGAVTSVLHTAPLMTPTRGTQVGFVDASGFPVYVFDLDLTMPGTSQCNGVCATHWPAIHAPATVTPSAPWGVIARSDGTKQLTYAGRPLYAYHGDQNANAAKGDLENAQGGIWRLAQVPSVSAPAKSP
jgi:predicted lipoprotein with Yx(FWY)xxD motif